MAKTYTQIVLPTGTVGRLVGGMFDTPRLKDDENKELTYPDGSLKAEYYIMLAIPKGSETHWNQTEWGAKIWAIGEAGYPGGFVNRHDFSWKITDGDSATPNKKGRKPCDREGYAGHWVVAATRPCPRDRLSPPQYVDIRTNPKNPVPIPADAIKHGYYVQAAVNVSDNTTAAGQPAKTPGVYINLDIIALAAYGQPIVFDTQVDAAQAGFGGFSLPAGAMTTPPAGLAVPPAAPVPNAPAAAGAAMSPASMVNAATAVPPANSAPWTASVTPNHQFAAGVPAPAPVAPPPAAPVRQMTAAAAGVTYEAYIAAGWTDDQLIANGLMLG